nr:MAG TPA: SeqA protein N-terminal domain [Caudoviricetes sp.]
MGNKRRSVRFDERTWMLLNELSKKTGASISVVIRGMVIRGMDELMDDSGNFKINEKPVQKD